MLVEAYKGRATTSSETKKFNVSSLRKRFAPRAEAQMRTVYIVREVQATSDVYEERECEYWGTPAEWRVLDAEALSLDEFDELAAYLQDSGQASM